VELICRSLDIRSRPGNGPGAIIHRVATDQWRIADICACPCHGTTIGKEDTGLVREEWANRVSGVDGSDDNIHTGSGVGIGERSLSRLIRDKAVSLACVQAVGDGEVDGGVGQRVAEAVEQRCRLRDLSPDRQGGRRGAERQRGCLHAPV